jgi:hypothetical protein
MASGYRTQRVTAADIQAGKIRLPHDTKALFPGARARVDIVLRGQPMTVSYDPRLGPDKERSGRLAIGPALGGLVAVDEVLEVSRSGSAIEVK